MKKTKLLLLTLSMASIGAIVAPIVTSCNSNTDNGISYQYFKDGQLAEVYTSQVTPKSTGAIFKKQTTGSLTSPATSAYIADIKSNPKILADDVLLCLNTTLAEASYQNFTYTVTNISSSKSVKIYGDDVQLLSATMKISIEHNGEQTKNQTESATISFNNFLPFVSFDAEGKNPQISLLGTDSFTALSITSSSVGFAYDYKDKDGNTITSFDLVADSLVEASALKSIINDHSDEIDESIVETFSLLNLGGSSASVPSSYFINQQQEI